MSGWCVLTAPRGDRAAVDALAARLTRSGCLRRCTEAGDLVLLTSGPVPCMPLEGGSGILVGHAFQSSGAIGEGPSWSPGEDGAAFVRRHWGAYVAIRPSGDGMEVLRDPSAMAPCYVAKAGPVWLVTDAPRLLLEQGGLGFAVDWPVVIASLVSRDWRSERTALAGIEEVLPGTTALLGPDAVTRRRAWDPWDFARPARGQDLSSEALADTIDCCAAAWSRVYRRPLIEISGGLDSAIVAAAFARQAQDPRLVTFAAGPGDPAELGYAQAIADHLGLPLEVTRPEIEDVDLTRSQACDLPRPNARAFTQAADALSRGHAEAIGADVFASGGGGDDLFGYRQSVTPAIDRLVSEGPGQGVVRTLDEIARISHANFWEAAARFVRRLAVRPPPAVRTDARLLAPGAIDRATTPASADGRRSRLPGKAAHVRAIATLPNHLEGHGRAAFAPVLFPLLSQPVVEFCLAVPSWHWCEGGRNRSLARRGFASRLPGPVIERRSKGAFEGFCARLFERNRACVGEMLLDGVLAGQEIIDGSAVKAAIRNPAPSGELVMRLLSLVDVEAWLQSWPGTEFARSDRLSTGLGKPHCVEWLSDTTTGTTCRRRYEPSLDRAVLRGSVHGI